MWKVYKERPTPGRTLELARDGKLAALTENDR
jgi:hypothetical protein